MLLTKSFDAAIAGRRSSALIKSIRTAPSGVNSDAVPVPAS